MTDDIVSRANSIVAAVDPAETIDLTIKLRIVNDRALWQAYTGWASAHGLSPEHDLVGALSDLMVWLVAGLPGVEHLSSGGGRVE